jgi:hypothetical protein
MTSTHSATWTEILTALGTVSAVIVALVLAGAPAIKRWWSKPVLEATTGLEEPFVRPVSDEHTPIAEVRLRVGITNTGRSTARSVRAQLLDWWEHDSRRALGTDWVELDSDPLPLKWVSLRPGDDRPGVPPEVAILNGAADYLDVALLDSQNLKILFDDNRRALFRRDTSSRTGTWRLEFVVGGTNCRIERRHTVEFTADGPNYFTRAALSDPPSDSRHAGLISLLRHGLGMGQSGEPTD